MEQNTSIVWFVLALGIFIFTVIIPLIRYIKKKQTKGINKEAKAKGEKSNGRDASRS